MEWNDRREGGGLHFYEPSTTFYYPQRGADRGPSMGVQGKLFREPKPVDAVRYPRGYTPERMREIHRANLDIRSGVTHRSKAAFAGPSGVARVRETLARSTVPADTLQGQEMSPSSPQDRLKIITAHKKVPNTVWGRYRSDASALRTGNFGQIELGSNIHEKEEKVGQALIHELGHAHSHHSGNPRYFTQRPVGRAEEEAAADDHMLTHWRPDPRDVRKGGGQMMPMSYESDNAFGPRAREAYRAARKTPLLTPEIRRKTADADGMPAVRQPGLFFPNGQPTNAAAPEGVLHPLEFGKL